MDTSHVKRKIDSQNFVIFSDTNTPLLYLQKDYMLTGIYLYIMLLWRLNFIVFFCFFFCKIMHFPTLFPGSGSAGLVSANIGAGRNCSQ